MIDIELLILFFSLLALYIFSFTDKNKLPVLLYILLFHITVFNFSVYLFYILNRNDNFLQSSIILSFLSKSMLPDNLIVNLTLIFSMLGFTYILLIRKITKKSDTSARFCLDALPEKIMAIEMDLRNKTIAIDKAKFKKYQFSKLIDTIGTLVGFSETVRMEYIINTVIIIFILFLTSINFIHRELNSIVIFIFIGYLIPIIILSSLTFHLSNKIENIFSA